MPDDLFLHSTHFVLMDKRGRIRGNFEGTEEEDRKQLAARHEEAGAREIRPWNIRMTKANAEGQPILPVMTISDFPPSTPA